MQCPMKCFDWNLLRMPNFMRPNMAMRNKDGTYPDSHMRIIHPISKNELIGESTNKHFGRSGRASVVVLDEYASVENSDSIWKAVRDVSDVIFCASTVNGRDNMFCKLRHSKKVPVKTLHWTLHPKKTNAWYEKRKETMEPHQIAQELDIDYDASATGRVYKRFEKHIHVAKHPIKPNPWYEQFITWDFGIADSMTMIFGQIDAEGVVQIYANYDVTDQDIEYFLPLTRGSRPPAELWNFISDTEKQRVNDLLDKVFRDKETGETHFLDFTHYGDHAGTFRSPNSRRTIKQWMGQVGINLITNPDQSFANRIQCVNNLLKYKQNSEGDFVPRLIVSPDCHGVIEAWLTYVWDGENIDKQGLKPKHNWASHYMSSIEFFATNRYPLQQPEQSTCMEYR